uniref:Ovule protein n=1 Tax=Syphacia muris TaxID=451379 RepID=A0A0N5AHM0_9BILA
MNRAGKAGKKLENMEKTNWKGWMAEEIVEAEENTNGILNKSTIFWFIPMYAHSFLDAISSSLKSLFICLFDP